VAAVASAVAPPQATVRRPGLTRRSPSGAAPLPQLRRQRHHGARAADVRDGLKPVQRRILYSMYNNLPLSGREVPEERDHRR
jgi:hypothetical protein